MSARMPVSASRNASLKDEKQVGLRQGLFHINNRWSWTEVDGLSLEVGRRRGCWSRHRRSCSVVQSTVMRHLHSTIVGVAVAAQRRRGRTVRVQWFHKPRAETVFVEVSLARRWRQRRLGRTLFGDAVGRHVTQHDEGGACSSTAVLTCAVRQDTCRQRPGRQ